MRKLFWGFIFIYLSFNLNINQFSLNIIPDFVGYILLMQGAGALKAESRLFETVRPFAMGMTIYTAILWIGALFGIANERGLSQLLNLIAMVVALYISWVLVQAVLEIERGKGENLQGEKLYQRWKGLMVVQIAAKVIYLLANFLNFGILAGLAALLAIVGLFMIALFLVAWYHCANIYELLTQGPQADPEI